MFVEETYEDPESLGYDLLQDLHLKAATPIMCHTRQTGGILHIFESGGEYYLWNTVEGSVHRFQASSFTNILSAMKHDDGGVGDLELVGCF
jgi:hypothetical protein